MLNAATAENHIGLPTVAPIHELQTRFSPCEFRVKWAESDWERTQAHALRRAVFCAEQRVFEHDDRDEIDQRAQLIVALSCVGGMPDEVLGTVRIHEEAPNVWWGSRLAVAADYRSHGRLGATLSRLAVCSAHACGCTEFYAHVQSQNAALFRRLHWRTVEETDIHGRPHDLMQVDLDRYPPCHTPFTGFVTHSINRAINGAISNTLDKVA
jgi:putative N-acetyltransferase (TIGR04045 family)